MRRALIALALVFSGCAALAQSNGESEIIASNASYPEGPLWSDGRLLVAEMGADRVTSFRGETRTTFFSRNGCGPTALASYGEGFAILCHIEHAVVLTDARGQTLRVLDRDAAGRRFQDPNDVSADDLGGVYFSDPGVFSTEFPPYGAIVYLNAEGQARRVVDGLWYPNGVFFDRDERALYVSETFRHRILRYAVESNGDLAEPSVFATLDFSAAPFGHWPDAYRERGPDGLERAPDGRLFVAVYGEGVVVALDRQGRVAGALASPTARYMTNIAFAPDGSAYTVGSSIHDRPPFTGEVRRFPHP